MKHAFVQCTFSVRSNSCRYELPWMMIIMPFCRTARELVDFDNVLEVLEYVLCGPCPSVWLRVTQYYGQNRRTGFFFLIRFGDCRESRFSSPFIYNERTFPKARTLSYISCKSKIISAHAVKAYGEWRYSSTHSQY
jgi:hypothetical protein